MKPNVLIVCEHASNAFGGEAILPLNYFLLLSERLSVVCLLTHERARENIESIADIDHRNVYYIPDTWGHIFLYRIGRFLPDRVAAMMNGSLMHLITQFYQWRMARRIVKQRDIDVVHEPAPVSPKQPSAMFFLGVPVVIGPMNGGMTFPTPFNHMAGRFERLLYGVSRWFSHVANLLMPGKLLADVMLVANERTRKALPYFRLGRVVELVENGVYSARISRRIEPKVSDTAIEVLFVGRLMDLKAVDIIIDAVAVCHHAVRLTIVGDGPERVGLERQSNRLKRNHAYFAGAVPSSKVYEYYDKADIFLLPSVRECGGAVILEAMARGVPVVATKWGGPEDYVTDETGILIEPLSREYLVCEFARSIDLLAANPELRATMGNAAISRIHAHFTWEKKIDRIVEIYRETLVG